MTYQVKFIFLNLQLFEQCFLSLMTYLSRDTGRNEAENSPTKLIYIFKAVSIKTKTSTAFSWTWQNISEIHLE